MATTKTPPPRAARISDLRRRSGGSARRRRASADDSLPVQPRRIREPAEDDGDREADGHRRERAPPAGPDRGPPGGHHHESRRQTDAEGLAGRCVGVEQADRTGHPDAEHQADSPEQQPWAMASQTAPSETVMANSARSVCTAITADRGRGMSSHAHGRAAGMGSEATGHRPTPRQRD